MDTVPEENISDQRHLQLLNTLERLLSIDGLNVSSVLMEAAQQLTETLQAEKIDIFLYEQITNSLVALGTSDTPLGRRQHALGLNRLPLANKGRLVKTFEGGGSYLTGHADQDPEELVGMVSPEGMGIRSMVLVPIEIDGKRRGILSANSRQPEHFSEQDLRFLEATARWVSTILHRTELLELHTESAMEQARRLAAQELLTILAHDLRNYLTPLKTRIDLVARRARRDQREQDLHDLEAASKTLLRFNRLISDLLDSTRLERGIFSITTHVINLVEIVEEVVAIFCTPDTTISVQTGEQEIIVAVDRERFQQVLENLLANALKHALPETPIQVVIASEEYGASSWATVTISNQTAAIPPDLQAHLFQPFVASPTSQGLGLGLYLARSIMEAHGGHLIMTTSPDGKIHFTLSLRREVQ